MFPVTTHRRAKSRAQGWLRDPTPCRQLRVRQQSLEKGGHHLPLGTGPFQGLHGDTAHLGVCLLDFSWASGLGCELASLLSPAEVLCPPGQPLVCAFHLRRQKGFQLTGTGLRKGQVAPLNWQPQHLSPVLLPEGSPHPGQLQQLLSLADAQPSLLVVQRCLPWLDTSSHDNIPPLTLCGGLQSPSASL